MALVPPADQNIIHRPPHRQVGYFLKNLGIIIGIVLVWRGVWLTLDAIDLFLFGGTPLYTAILGIIVGLFILYVPDRDLKEIGEL